MWFILLSLLDLHAVAAAGAPPSLSVKLELTGSRYRITHHFPAGRGTEPMRFVTGATDKNCDEPMDVLVIDGKPERLFSMLPCGGFAFRSTKSVKPGESWIIEGEATLPPGQHQVIARYCARQEDLKLIAPAERDIKAPAWWLSCAESAPVKIGDRPEDAWQALLAAMRAGDLAAMSRLTTTGGMASLKRGVQAEPEVARFKSLGKSWSSFEVRWKTRTAERAEAWMGPQVKEHGLVFVRTGGEWRLDRWSPGE
jgi:hypothetical protein